MREAALDLARGDIGKAVKAYQANGRVIGAELTDEAITSLIADWSRDYDPSKSTLILAYLRHDVRKLNEKARAKLVERGIIDHGYPFKTALGEKSFAAGDKIFFLKNDEIMRVKNGTIAAVTKALPHVLEVEVGERGRRRGRPRRITLMEDTYNRIDYGYATTVHKAQGTTVDKVRVLASPWLDRHLTCVAMSRHREELYIYYSRQSFAKCGGLEQVLARKNAKQATLDYEEGDIEA